MIQVWPSEDTVDPLPPTVSPPGLLNTTAILLDLQLGALEVAGAEKWVHPPDGCDEGVEQRQRCDGSEDGDHHAQKCGGRTVAAKSLGP